MLIPDACREAIRFSPLTYEGKLLIGPLDVSEDALLILMGDAIAAGVFSAGFLTDLGRILDAQADARYA